MAANPGPLRVSVVMPDGSSQSIEVTLAETVKVRPRVQGLTTAGGLSLGPHPRPLPLTSPLPVLLSLSTGLEGQVGGGV